MWHAVNGCEPHGDSIPVRSTELSFPGASSGRRSFASTEDCHRNSTIGPSTPDRMYENKRRPYAASLGIGPTAAGDCIRRARRVGLT
jgi:hypothetical protein